MEPDQTLHEAEETKQVEHIDPAACADDIAAAEASSADHLKPLRIVVFNMAAGWCRDVTVDLVDELRGRIVEYDEISGSVLALMDANRR